MRALITGATGHIGRSLTGILVGDGHQVAVLARADSALERLGELRGRIEIVPADLTDPVSVGTALKAVRPDVVFHLGWFGVNKADRSDERQIDLNLVGSLNLARAARHSGVRCFVGLGSQAEFGPNSGPLTEDTPTKPTTLYGATKLAVGAITLALANPSSDAGESGMRCCWIRLLATYGPFDDETHLIPSVIRSLLRGRAPALSAGSQKVDYLFVDDAAKALCRLALTPGASGVFVLGSGEAHTVQEIAVAIGQLVDPTIGLRFGELRDDGNRPADLLADTTRLQAITGWQPSTPLIEGLRRTVSWYRNRLTRNRELVTSSEGS